MQDYQKWFLGSIQPMNLDPDSSLEKGRGQRKVAGTMGLWRGRSETIGGQGLCQVASGRDLVAGSV